MSHTLTIATTLAAAIAATAALSSCDPYHPTYEGLTCSATGDCPGGFTCSEGVCLSAAALCGNGVLDARETCDDGNGDEGDGCDATCATATCYVPVTHATVAEGIADATCPTVYVAPGVHLGSISITRATTLAGVGAEPAILDAGGTGSVITVASGVTATLRKLTLRNGRAAQGAGVNSSGTLTLESVIVTENTAAADSPSGGGIANLGGSLTLTGVQVTKNHLTSTAVAGGATPVLTGAGIVSTGGIVRLDGGSLVESNDITVAGTGLPGVVGRGAGISATTTALTLAGASFIRGNAINVDGGIGRATANGGGLFVNSGSLKVEAGSGIDGNTASAKGIDAGGNIGANARGGGLYATSATLTFDNAFVRDNRAVAQGPRATTATAGGAAIFNNTLIANAVTITGNSATASGLTTAATSAIAEVGGLDLENVSGTITASTISTNSVSASTESATAASAANGGIRELVFGSSVQALTLVRCTIDGNSATSLDGTALRGGLDLDVAGSVGLTTTLTARLSETTISNNLARGAVAAQIGGLDASAANGDATLNLYLVNTTISGNRADSAQGTASIGALRVNAANGTAKVNAILASSTVTENSATSASSAAGGIDLILSGASAALTFTTKSSILGNNVAAANANCRSSMPPLTSAGYNLFGPLGTCTVGGVTTGNQSGVPGLAALADNGGPTRTHALLGTSLALNAGNPTGCTDHLNAVLTTDQRGLPRAAGGRCDIGAFEAQ